MRQTLRTVVEPNEFVRALQRVGLLPDSDLIESVYISIEPQRPVDIQVRMLADDRLYDIVTDLAEEVA